MATRKPAALFNDEGILCKTQLSKARLAFETEQRKYANATLSLTPYMYGRLWMGYVNPDTQSKWCLFLDGWCACLKQQS